MTFVLSLGQLGAALFVFWFFGFMRGSLWESRVEPPTSGPPGVKA